MPDSLLRSQLAQRVLPETENNQYDTVPLFFRLRQRSERESLSALLRERPFIQIHDYMHAQLQELIRSQNPGLRFNPAELEDAIDQHIQNEEIADYGVWVYYPWHEKLVHLLDEQEFVSLRTNRNQYKITKAEHHVLANQKIGIIGLSVGQSVALTMAMERTFGELRIADFDTLDLTNLNRIRTGLYNLGIPKVVAVAREIAEIDPYLKVTCFGEGVHKDNMEQFFLERGKLDILVDECDSIDIKLSARLYARSLHIPVIMDTSDRGMMDIERFDLEPERPLLHGRVNESEIKPGQPMSPEQRLQLSIQIVGLDTISDKLQYSLSEIGKTISTWPQLASAVVMGGAVATQVCRKIALKEDVPSGRFYVDTDQILRGKPFL